MAEYTEQEARRMATQYAIAAGCERGKQGPCAYCDNAVREILSDRDLWGSPGSDAVLAERARIDAERTPAPSVEECMRALLIDIDKVKDNRRALDFDEDKIHAFLAALPDEARRVGMAAVKGGK